jgi:hypothetical protein
VTRWALPLLLGLSFAVTAQAQQDRTLELDGGVRVAYTVWLHPANAHTVHPAAVLAPTTALDAARLLNLHLSTGDIEEAALLSNSPQRRFEVLRDYRRSVSDDEFKRVFTQYLAPENRLVAEIAIGRHRLLIWELKQVAAPTAPEASHLAGQYFVEVEGRYLVDDVPSETRTSLRRVLEAYRTGKIRD